MDILFISEEHDVAGRAADDRHVENSPRPPTLPSLMPNDAHAMKKIGSPLLITREPSCQEKGIGAIPNPSPLYREAQTGYTRLKTCFSATV